MLDPPRPPLPPLRALRAFEAAARHESFVAAAQELHVSASAIAQLVRKLEDWGGRKLFHRRPQGIVLTDAARASLPALTQALEALRRAAADLAAGGGAIRIRLAALPAIAQCWLAPRLARLQRDLPGIELSVTAQEQPPDFRRDDVHAALFFAAAPPPGMIARHLMDDAVAPVCSPALGAGPPAMRRPADLAAAELLHDSTWRADWPDWLQAEGLGGAVDAGRGPAYSLYSLVVQAALDGTGVAIGHYPLVAAALAEGRLVAPFGAWRRAKRAIWLLLPPGGEAAPGMADLIAWLEREALPGFDS